MSCDVNMFCSGHANICAFNSNNSSNTCTCLEGYTGASCGACVSGYVNIAAAGEPANCKKDCEYCYDGERTVTIDVGLPIGIDMTITAHGQCDYATGTCVCLDGYDSSNIIPDYNPASDMNPYCSTDPNASSGE